MVNKTQFHKTKIALAVVLSIGLAACGDDGSTTTGAEAVIAQQQGLMGTVSGKVQDTNGRPVADAMVYFAGQETTTDAGGNYVFADVLVTSLNGNNDEGNGAEDDEILTSLTVTVTGPEGYISAVVNVRPQAVVNNTGGSDADTGATGAIVTASTFVDGFIAEAGVAVIAEENSMVTGYLRTGNATPAAGETVYLDFTGYAAGVTLAGSAGATAGAVVTLTPGEYSAVTAADGSFTFENVPADSAFVLGVTGKTITTADTDGTSNGSVNGQIATDGGITVATPFEQDENFVGTFEVIDNEFAVEEDVTYNPWVASVDGVLNPTVGITDGGVTYGDLNDGINKEVTINFSEALDTATFDTTKVIVAETGKQYLATDSVVLSADGLSLTVVFAAELAPGTKFTVFISQASSIDDEGNALNVTRDITNPLTATNAAPFADGSNTTIVYDVLNSVTNKAKYIEVNLCTYLDGNSGVIGATAVQVLDEDTDEDGATIGLQAYSDAFRDAEDLEENANSDARDVAQLNGQADTAGKLKALGDAVLSVQNIGETFDEVDVDFPWITIHTGDASTFAISTDVLDSNVIKIEDDSVIAVSGPTNTTAAITATAAIAALGADYGIDGAKDGDKVTVTFMDDFGIAAADQVITLIDALPPTTTLQESYDLSSASAVYGKILSTAGEADYGNGGEVSNDGSSAEVGNPVIWVQPRHLQQKGLSNAAPTRDSENTFGTLSNLVPSLDTGETGFTATTYIDNRATYDATAFTAWAATSVGNEIGIDFSEDIALTTTAPTPTGLTAGLSAYIVNNNVTTDVDGNSLAGSNADLVQVTVANVMTLANTDNGGFVDFVGAVRDTSAAENTATAVSNAKVIFRDAMPPLVTAAEWDGTEIVLTFNEAIAIDATTTITLVNPTAPGTTITVTLDPSALATVNTGFVLSNDDKTVTVNVSGTAGINTVFEGSSTADQEFFYEDGGNTGEDQHAIVRWDNITDATATRNEWNTFTPAAADAAGSQAQTGTTFGNRWETEAPQFLMVNGVGSYQYTVSTSGYLDVAGAPGDDDGTVTYTINFSHPIDLATSNQFSDAINTYLGTPGFPLPTTAIVNGSTANAAGVTLLDTIFQVEVDGVSDNNSPFTIATTPVSATVLHGAFSLSADQRIITLTVTGLADTILFGQSTVEFDVTTTSALTGEQTSAAPFAWQNVN